MIRRANEIPTANALRMYITNKKVNTHFWVRVHALEKEGKKKERRVRS